MTKQFVISIMTRDRVGIIADVALALQKLQGNLADLSQTVLGGYFTMILTASFPDRVTEADIRRGFSLLDPAEPFEVGIKLFDSAIAEAAKEREPQGRYILTVSGPDRIGFVAVVTSHLRDRQINIADVATTVADNNYIMFLLLEITDTISIAELKQSLRRATAGIGATVELQHDEIFRATNEIG